MTSRPGQTNSGDRHPRSGSRRWLCQRSCYHSAGMSRVLLDLNSGKLSAIQIGRITGGTGKLAGIEGKMRTIATFEIKNRLQRKPDRYRILNRQIGDTGADVGCVGLGVAGQAMRTGRPRGGPFRSGLSTWDDAGPSRSTRADLRMRRREFIAGLAGAAAWPAMARAQHGAKSPIGVRRHDREPWRCGGNTGTW